MKLIGLIGGLTWESTQEYYRILNESAKAWLGGYSSARCLLYSFDFAEVEKLQMEGAWDQLDHMMADAAQSLYRGGAEVVVLCTNTMHLSSEKIKASVPIPFLHIAEATGRQIKSAGLTKVGLLGTNFTMEKDFYKKVLKEAYGIETIIPNFEDRQVVHTIIYEELVFGNLQDISRQQYVEIINRLASAGAEGVILGCTEIPLLIHEKDVEIPIFNTTRIHAEAAMKWAMGEG